MSDFPQVVEMCVFYSAYSLSIVFHTLSV